MADGETWRLARSLEVLRSEIKAKSPNTTVYTIGDPDHQARDSDHNPNAEGVVCAIDIMPGNGLDLRRLFEDIRTSGHPDLRYVIYQDDIAHRRNGYAITDHTGDYHEHVHVSVGTGPDGESTGLYDNTEPWLEDSIMALTPIDAEVMAWRVAAMATGTPTTTGGPRKGERIWIVEALLALSGVNFAGRLDAILTAALNDGQLSPEALEELRAIRADIATLPPLVADAVVDEQAERLQS